MSSIVCTILGTVQTKNIADSKLSFSPEVKLQYFSNDATIDYSQTLTWFNSNAYDTSRKPITAIETLSAIQPIKNYFRDGFIYRTDSFFDKVQLLLKFDDAIGSNSFRDWRGHDVVGINTAKTSDLLNIKKAIVFDGVESNNQLLTLDQRKEIYYQFAIANGAVDLSGLSDADALIVTQEADKVAERLLWGQYCGFDIAYYNFEAWNYAGSPFKSYDEYKEFELKDELLPLYIEYKPSDNTYTLHYNPYGTIITAFAEDLFYEVDRAGNVLFLDGEPNSFVEVSPNNSRNEPSSFNLFQDDPRITRSSSIDWCFEFSIRGYPSKESLAQIEIDVAAYKANLLLDIESDYQRTATELKFVRDNAVLVAVDQIDIDTANQFMAEDLAWAQKTKNARLFSVDIRTNIERSRLFDIACRDTYNKGGWIASNSFEKEWVFNSTTNNWDLRQGGVDWGIRLANGKLIVVIGDVDYYFDLPIEYETGYSNTLTFYEKQPTPSAVKDWKTFKVLKSGNTLKAYLVPIDTIYDNDFVYNGLLGTITGVATHEKRTKNYFRIGGATTNAIAPIRALLDEVRFTIGESRTPTLGQFYHYPYPTTKEAAFLSIGFEPQFAFADKLPSSGVFALSSNLPAFEIGLSLTGMGIYAAIELPKTSLSIQISKASEFKLTPKLPALIGSMAIAGANDIEIDIVIPDFNTPLEQTSGIDIPVNLSILEISISTSANSHNEIPVLLPLLNSAITISQNTSFTITGALPKIEINLSGQEQYINTISGELPILQASISFSKSVAIDMAINLPALETNALINPPFDFVVGLNPLEINLSLSEPPFTIDSLSQWFNELLADFNNNLYTDKQINMTGKLPVLDGDILIQKNTLISAPINLPEIQTTLFIGNDMKSPKIINIPIKLPELVIDTRTYDMTIKSSLNPLNINLVIFSGESFL